MSSRMPRRLGVPLKYQMWLTGVELGVAGGAEDALVEEAVLLRLERAVVDRLGLRDLALRPVTDLLGGRERDPDRVEVIDLEHRSPWPRCGRQRHDLRASDDVPGRWAWSRWGGPRSVLEPGEVDAAEVGERIGRDVLGEVDLLFVLVEGLPLEAEALQLLDEDLEGLGHAGRLDLFALDDRLVGLDAAHDVVGLHGQQLLQDVRRAVGFERPDLHLTEALAAELGLAAQRLLGDEAVGAGRPSVDLVLDEVVQLQHVDVAHRDLVVEGLPRAPVAQLPLAPLRPAGGAGPRPHLVLPP